MTSQPKVTIRFDNKELKVDSGSQLAAALMQHRIFTLRSSPEGQDRGVLCAMGSCQECRATVDGHRGVRTCLVTVRDGMEIATERPLRRELQPLVERSEMVEKEAGVVVIGAGPAGLSAACHAAELGQDVLLVDESPRPGGRIWAHRDSVPAVVQGWIDRAQRAGVRWLQGGTVVDGAMETGAMETGAMETGASGSVLTASVVDGRRTYIRCQKIIVATGARERFLPFPGWTLPGVLGAGALQSLIKGGLDVEGKRLVIAGSGPLLLAVAQLGTSRGADVLMIEQASLAQRLPLVFSLLSSTSRLFEAWKLWKELRGIEKCSSSWPVKAEGQEKIEKVHLQTRNGIRIEPADLLAVGFGLVPESRVAQGLGCFVEQDGTVKVDELQQSSIRNVLCAGEPTGVAGSEAALASGQVAGIVAAGATPSADLLAKVRRLRGWGVALERAHSLRSELKPLASEDVTICRCEDVTASTVEGVGSLREARMQCRIAMGPCQGRVCVPILAFRDGLGQDSVRPPWSTSPAPQADLSSTDGH
ncbi:MAG: FAD-dependent oxidoreductase [Planctomycetota bacterium]